MMQGDQYRLPINICLSDGSTVTPESIAELEIYIGNLRKTFSDGSVTFNGETSEFYVYLTQEETFALRGTTNVQIRIKFINGDVIGVDAGDFNVDPARSKEVL